MRPNKERIGKVLLACLLSSMMPLSAADNQTPAVQPASEIEQLKKMLADQQKQINELRQALAQQQQKKENEPNVSASAASPAASPAGSPVIPPVDPAPVSNYRNLGQVASTTPLLPRIPKPPVALALPAIPAAVTCPTIESDVSTPIPTCTPSDPDGPRLSDSWWPASVPTT